MVPTYHQRMHVELWDLEVKTLLYDFDTPEEAVDAARELTVLNPGRYPQQMARYRADRQGDSGWVARGEALLQASEP
jgi:hypothetical protein